MPTRSLQLTTGVRIASRSRHACLFRAASSSRSMPRRPWRRPDRTPPGKCIVRLRTALFLFVFSEEFDDQLRNGRRICVSLIVQINHNRRALARRIELAVLGPIHAARGAAIELLHAVERVLLHREADERVVFSRGVE